MPRSLPALYLMLGVSAGLPFAMYNAVLTLRLARHGVDIVLIGFFAWIALLPTVKFLWAPLVDRIAVPGFGAFWGRRRGWIMLAQLGIVTAMAGMAATADDRNLPLTALWAMLLAFWATTLEVAADGWRIVVAPDPIQQGPIVTAYVWGYRGAMVAAGSGAIAIAGRAGWSPAYLTMAALTALPLPLLWALPPEPGHRGGRSRAILIGCTAGTAILGGSGMAIAAAGTLLGRAAAALPAGSAGYVTPIMLLVGLLPFAVLAAALPRIRRLPADAPARRSGAIGGYVDLFWRFGFATLPLLAFISCYRMGDVLALTLSHPLWNARGYPLGRIAVADGAIAVAASVAGVAAGGWMAARWRMGPALAVGAIGSAIGNGVFAWLWRAPPAAWVLYLSAAIDQFAHGIEGALFVVYLSLLVNPRHASTQYAFLSGCAFLLPRLLAGASGAIQQRIGYDGFFLLAGALSAAAILFLPVVLPIRPRI